MVSSCSGVTQLPIRFSNVHVSPASSCSPSASDALNPSSSVPSASVAQMLTYPLASFAVFRVFGQRRHEIMVAQFRVRVLFFGGAFRFPLDIQPKLKPLGPVHRMRLNLGGHNRLPVRQKHRLTLASAADSICFPSASKPTR